MFALRLVETSYSKRRMPKECKEMTKYTAPLPILLTEITHSSPSLPQPRIIHQRYFEIPDRVGLLDFFFFRISFLVSSNTR